jgi:hypothetical protein
MLQEEAGQLSEHLMAIFHTEIMGDGVRVRVENSGRSHNTCGTAAAPNSPVM